MISPLKIASRESPLALKQTALVVKALQELTNTSSSVVGISTRGDQILDKPLSKIGGKELFIRELQTAMLKKEADCAVHSLKDMSAVTPPDFVLAAVGFAEEAGDAMVSNRYPTLSSLPQGSIVGTSSPRRQALLRHYYPKLQGHFIRGNLQTRLDKLKRGEYDALLLAVAGLKRLGLAHLIREFLPIDQFIPAPGQGLIAIECLAHRSDLISLLAHINEPTLMRRAKAERAFAAAMNGDCHTPLAAYASDIKNKVNLNVFYAEEDGQCYRASLFSDCPEKAGLLAAHTIQSQLNTHASSALPARE